MAMNLLFLISFSNLTLSLIVVYAPPLLLLLAAVVTMALLAPAAMQPMPKIEAQMRMLRLCLIGAALWW